MRLGLANGKDVSIDQSIHSGYIESIRRGKRVIFIETQYFMGSCASWKDEESECLNLVPVEIALTSKIRRGERFSVYVVTPMWHDGEMVQAILHSNRHTYDGDDVWDCDSGHRGGWVRWEGAAV